MQLYVYVNQREVRFSTCKRASLTSSGRLFTYVEEGPHEIDSSNLLEIDPDIYVIANRKLQLMFESLNQTASTTEKS